MRKSVNVILEKFNISKIPPRVPFYFIEVTNACNLNCDFCPRYNLSRGTGFMEFDLFKLVIRRINEMGARYVNINRFGESLVHPQFLEMLRYAKDQGIPNLGYVSNGQLLTPDVVEEMVQAGIDRITISLDTLDKEEYEKHRKGAQLEKTVNNLNYLIEYRNKLGRQKPIISINSVLIADNFEQMERIFRRYVNKVNFIEFRGVAEYGPSKSADKFLYRKKPQFNVMSCIQPWQRLNFNFNGDVNPCCGDVDGELIIGNIKDSSIKELWYGEKIKRIRKIHAQKAVEELPVCVHCDCCNRDWYDQRVKQLREVYHGLDPDIHVVGLEATSPIFFRHSTKRLWR
jgi:radical SAM protein with 4Fe4S-binding SPASM domain